MATDTLLAAMDLCGLRGDSWAPWRTVAKCLDAQPLDPTELALFRQCTGRSQPPTEPPAEAWLICGRRAGKSRYAGACAVRAASRRYPVAPGEQATIAMAAADREQARVLYSYATAPFTTATTRTLRALMDLVVRKTRWQLDRSTNVSLEVRSSHFGRIRGRTFALALADEVAFWQAEDGSNPASEVIAAIRPGLATLGGQLLVISSPFSKAGPLWEVHQKYFAVADPRILVWVAPTRVMNPTISSAVVEDALARDPEAAKSEWLAEFRDDAAALVTDTARRRVIRAVEPSEVPPFEGSPLVFVDVASGSGSDSFTAGVAVKTRDAQGRLIAFVLDLGETRPPFDPAHEVAQLADACKSLGVTRVFGDKYAQGWTDALFRQAGLTYEPSPLTKSEIYLAMLSLINSGLVSLPNEARLITQLMGLVRRPTGSGRESVDHAARSGAHDDLANAAAGAAVLLGAAPTTREYRVL
jgi:hypothetical protein